MQIDENVQTLEFILSTLPVLIAWLWTAWNEKHRGRRNIMTSMSPSRKKLAVLMITDDNNQQRQRPTNNNHSNNKAAPPVSLSRRTIGSNWQSTGASATTPVAMTKHRSASAPHRLPVNAAGIRLTKHIAMDCEMVGIGFAGKKHQLARVSIVNQMGEVLLDKYVRPVETVVDYRTEVSGIRPRDLRDRAEEFTIVQQEVAALLSDRFLVGHAIYNDLKVLQLQHPPRAIRDTSKYRPLVQRITGGATPSLKTLARCVLGEHIQVGEHSSVEDARAAMRIFNRYQEEWERSVRSRKT